MGKKRTRKRKLFFLFITSITALFIIQGCTNIKSWQAKRKLNKANKIMIKGKFEKSLDKNKEVLRLFPQMLGDQAHYQMGLNYAHPENPELDYQKAIEIFQSIILEYPKSKLRDEATIWILSLRKFAENSKRIEELENQIKKLKEVDLGIEEKKRISLPNE